MPFSGIFVLLTGLGDLKDSLNSRQNHWRKRRDKSTWKLPAPCYRLQQKKNMRYDVISLAAIFNAMMSHVLRKLP